MAPLPAAVALENHSISVAVVARDLYSTGLYLHIPFCSVKCRFCDFAAYPGRLFEIPRYVRMLCREIESQARRMPRAALETFYVGGGTPSLLGEHEWRQIFSAVRTHFHVLPYGEASLEANPEGVSQEKAAFWLSQGFNRLSLGLQTDDPALLVSLGRTHSWDLFVQAFRAARRQGFSNVNVDLMFGLPGQTLKGWAETLARVVELSPTHVSVYGLQVEEFTYFHKLGVEANEDVQADMYEQAADFLESAGYEHYEISNFALPGFACRHNLRYWRNQQCRGAGVSAAWYDGIVRHTNTENLTDYLNALSSGADPEVEQLCLSEAEREGENLLLGLRLKEGVVPTVLGKKLYGTVLRRSVREGLLTVEPDGRYRPTRRGWRLSNRIFVDLLGASAVESSRERSAKEF